MKQFTSVAFLFYSVVQIVIQCMTLAARPSGSIGFQIHLTVLVSVVLAGVGVGMWFSGGFALLPHCDVG